MLFHGSMRLFARIISEIVSLKPGDCMLRSCSKTFPLMPEVSNWKLGKLSSILCRTFFFQLWFFRERSVCAFWLLLVKILVTSLSAFLSWRRREAINKKAPNCFRVEKNCFKSFSYKKFLSPLTSFPNDDQHFLSSRKRDRLLEETTRESWVFWKSMGKGFRRSVIHHSFTLVVVELTALPSIHISRALLAPSDAWLKETAKVTLAAQ